MKMHLADAARDVPGNSSYPITSVLGGFPAARVLCDMIGSSLNRSLANWRREEIAENHRLTCTAIRCQFQRGVQP
jgi:hypothetical protein